MIYLPGNSRLAGDKLAVIPESLFSPRVSVALADSDLTYRERLLDLFAAATDLQLLPESYDPADGGHSDILLVAALSEPKQTFALLERVHASGSTGKIILLVSLENQDFFVRAVRAGCRGILNKDTTDDLLLKCVRKVYEGEMWVDRATTAQILRQITEEHPSQKPKERDLKNSPLSPREREIVGLVIQGYKNKELAEKLTISEQTVKNHMHNIFDKLGVADRLELTLYAIHHNLHKTEAE